jgi:hypothetical protein
MILILCEPQFSSANNSKFLRILASFSNFHFKYYCMHLWVDGKFNKSKWH